MNDLEMYREQLALCDDKIIDALVERNAIIEKIMAYKETYGMPILQPAQEAKQERRLNEKLKDNKYQDEIHDVFKRILRNSKRIQARKLFSYNIVLIGFMGAGKSTISDYLSTMFDMKLVEMDQEIVEREEMSIPDILLLTEKNISVILRQIFSKNCRRVRTALFPVVVVLPCVSRM